VLAVAVTGAVACSDTLPTQGLDAKFVSFTLSEDSARAFREALNDVRERILPTLSPDDASSPLSPPLVELTAAIDARDLRALERALACADAAIAKLDRGDDASAAIGSELDAVRLILEHARPLADDAPRTARR
jgi:hypothetical protein